ncbi:hypothetical protein KV557_24850 [Kitasatospora aureofaciens]|uniref:hypothetical protein n=1 Tax=Kitasatospora aureofaciens TaxID=1894 RepID=UPI001C471D8D|nr:hypothetical protein [Kitasatospora aureofaciens]MBV6700295.1 hypothetical protein [Kitasatospora aureofaciens]
MKTINGRTYVDRGELIERSGYSRATLANLWRDRDANGHPPALTIDRIMHWDVEVWLDWEAARRRTRNEQERKVDRSGDPAEELPGPEQARVLGLEPDAIRQYRRNPPKGWPEPVREEEIAPGQFREWRTRQQLWDYADGRSRAGVAGRRAAAGPNPHVQRAVEALEAADGRSVGQVAAELAAETGESVHTWKRRLTEARKQMR